MMTDDHDNDYVYDYDSDSDGNDPVIDYNDGGEMMMVMINL